MSDNGENMRPFEKIMLEMMSVENTQVVAVENTAGAHNAVANLIGVDSNMIGPASNEAEGANQNTAPNVPDVGREDNMQPSVASTTLNNPGIAGAGGADAAQVNSHVPSVDNENLAPRRGLPSYAEAEVPSLTDADRCKGEHNACVPCKSRGISKSRLDDCDGKKPCNNCTKVQGKSKMQYQCRYDATFNKAKGAKCPDELLISDRPSRKPKQAEVPLVVTRGTFASVKDLKRQLEDFIRVGGIREGAGHNQAFAVVEANLPVLRANLGSTLLQEFLYKEQQIENIKSARVRESQFPQNLQNCLKAGDWFGGSLLGSDDSAADSGSDEE